MFFLNLLFAIVNFDTVDLDMTLFIDKFLELNNTPLKFLEDGISVR
jgi:hypothetical protein